MPADDADNALAALRDQISRMGPGLSKIRPKSRVEIAEERAAEIYCEATEVCPDISGRELARRWLKRDERLHRDYKSGARNVPVSALLLLPYPARVAALAALAEAVGLKDIDTVDEDEEQVA